MTDESSPKFREFAELIRRHERGHRTHIETPFGPRLITYADLTATGRHLEFVDEWIRRVVPFYANSHTQISSTGRLVTELRESARRAIHGAINAADDDVVLFVGAGATAAVNKLVGLLGLRISEPLDRDHGLRSRIPERDRPVVFIGPYEHHSNLLPWLESVADVVEVGLDESGRIDLADLEHALESHADRRQKFGSFSAASNVTGIISDVPGLARLLRRHEALVFFDYAAAAPYVPIDMSASGPEDRIDALFLSTHKFVGGPESSGILAVNRALFRTATPERPGGGTVDYVAGATHADVDYVSHPAEREEGGTPSIMGDLRAGAAFLVKEMIGPEEILGHELSLARQAIERLSRHPKIKVLGPTDVPRLAIVSVTIDDLHHDLASALLDHLFGIQNRAGCSCAGPYGHSLLGIDRETSSRFRKMVKRGINGMKPGWVRLSLPYYASDEDIEFILSAVEFVAEHGRNFTPLYSMGWRDGVWRHVENTKAAAPGMELSADALEKIARSAPDAPGETAIDAESLRNERARYFEEARETAAALRERWESSPPNWNPPTGDHEVDDLVWFRYVHTDGLPSDVHA